MSHKFNGFSSFKQKLHLQPKLISTTLLHSSLVGIYVQMNLVAYIYHLDIKVK